jgi:hypothetical protein
MDILTSSKITEREGQDKEPAGPKIRKAIAKLDGAPGENALEFFDTILGEVYDIYPVPLVEQSTGLRIVEYFFNTQTWTIKPQQAAQFKDAYKCYFQLKESRG